jgi:uncharacterized protein DUF3618
VTSPVTDPNDPDQIRREIERTQAHLSNDVDALTEKVTPSRIVERRVDRAKDTASRLKDKVMGSDSGPTNPYGRHTGQSVQGMAGSVAGTASATASSISDTASDAASSAAAAVQEAPHAVRRQTQGNPLAAGLIAFGAGWLISSLLPASRREQELAEQAKNKATELGQPLAEAAKQAATEMKDNLQEPAQQAVESVKSTATDAGRTVADEGRYAAQDVHSSTQDAAGTVRHNASS